MFTNIFIKDTNEAEIWQHAVEMLNRETEALLIDSGTALQEVKDDADSTIVDEIYHYGGQIIEGSNHIIRGMTELVTVTGTLLSKVNAVLDAGAGAVMDAIFKSGF